MDLITATSIADIIASIGVVVSLIFVAREFRRTARNTDLGSAAKAIETMVHQFAHLADEPDKAERLRRGLADFDSLSQSEKGQVSAVIHDTLLAFDVLRRARQSGLMSQADFTVMRELWISLMRTRGARQWWAGWKTIMPEAVVAYVEASLDDPDLKVKPLNEEIPWLFAPEDAIVASQTQSNQETEK